jgi:DNA-binding GntR family transcriptional regulator
MTGLFDGHSSLSRTAGDAAVETIRQAILDGRLAPGSRLTEERLARELGISRTPVREALKVLQSEGLVDTAPNRSATVRAFELGDLEDMYELRALLEGCAARRAASRISAEQLSALRASCERFEQMNAGEDLNELIRENFVFHSTILEAARSPRLAGMVRQVVELPLVYRSYVWYSPEQARISQHYHRQVTLALERRDAERAELVMKEHVLEARDVLIAHVEKQRMEGVPEGVVTE